MRYGLPYKGSKNAIAKWIVDQLPKAETFCDLFFGGGAVTHRALLSGKYKKSEIIFTNERTYNSLSREQKEIAGASFSQQLSFFDL